MEGRTNSLLNGRMEKTSWSVLCGGEAPPVFHVNGGDIDLCWNEVVIGLPSHFLLLFVATAICLFPPSSKGPVTGLFRVRQVVCILLVLAPLCCGISWWFLVHNRPPVVWMSFCLQMITYLSLALSTRCTCALLLSANVWQLAFINLAWFMAFSSAAFSAVLAASHALHSTDFYRSAYGLPYSVSTFVIAGLHLCYLVTLAIGFFQKPQYVDGSHRAVQRRLVRVGVQDSGETEPLLSRSFSDYDTVRSGDRHGGVEQLSVCSEEDRSSLAAVVMFTWMKRTLELGWKGELKSADDLDTLPRALQTGSVRARFDRHLGVAIEQAFTLDRKRGRLSGKPAYSSSTFSLLRSLNKAFGWDYYPLGLLRFACDLLGFVGPILLHALVVFIEDKSEPMAHGYYYAAGLLVSTLLVALLQSQFSFRVNKVMVAMRAALVTAVYRKALAVDSVNLGVFTTGEIVNLMSTDGDRVVNFANSFHTFWSLPFQVAVALYLLHQQVGLAFLAGLGFSLAMIPINRFLASKIGSLSQAMMEKKDGRVKVMAEILRGIRVIKFYAWEAVFGGKVEKLREEELSNLKGRKYLDALCVYLWAATPVMISLLTFGTYVALGHKLTAAKVFTSVALFNMLITPLNAFPWVLNGLMESWVSVKRLQAFFTLPQVCWSRYYVQAGDDDDEAATASEDALHLSRAEFSWSASELASTAKRRYLSGNTKPDDGNEVDDEEESTDSGSRFHLAGIDFKASKGHLIGVAGSVGSGKSSLLAAITAEMSRADGQVYSCYLQDGFGLVSQETWLQHATIRDNILFGKPMNPVRYQEVLHACALQEDLAVLPAGDQTEVGENGVTLSGGQKARISLARAAYQDKDIYLLDDPLAAVDVHVAQHLFRRCIAGLMSTKTRILCTHHLQFLASADHVLVMEDGRIARQGLPADVLPKEALSSQIGRNLEAETGKEAASEAAEGDSGCDAEADVLVEEERREKGVVSTSVYKSYWKAVGNVLAPAVLLSLFLMQASLNLSDWWLSYWISHTTTLHPNSTSYNSSGAYTNHSVDAPLSQPCTYSAWQLFALLPMPACHEYGVPVVYTDGVLGNASSNASNSSSDLRFYLTVYGCLGGANTMFTLLRAFLFAYGGVCAARVLHDRLLRSILHAPVSFFDVTPVGRMLNRFSTDCYSIDDTLPFQLNILLAQLFGLLGTIAITCYGLPWFALLLLPLAVIYYRVQRYYRRTSRELKRLSTVTLSPVYGHFSETLAGLSTIRAMRAVFRFAEENERRLDVNQRANYTGYATAVWLSLRLQLLGVAMVAGVAFIAVLEHHYWTVDAGLVGLAVSYALSVTGRLSGVVQMFTETEKEMISTERVMQYITGVGEEKQVVRPATHAC
eukprot:scpid8147/ scgid4352/ Multidrug resistance-associated protein 7; ATP-binding cassette sub-family C member 10